MVMPTAPARRMLLVHAHPDDETIGNGATMARYAAEGAQVTLVTCTRGEEGEVLVPDLEHLGVDHDDTLGAHREAELAAAMDALGVTDYRFLGEPGELRDSGMAYDENNRAVARETIRPETFWATDLLVANRLVAIIREVRPQVLITYDENGAYGHPDHIQAHRVATYAHALASIPSYRLDLGEPWQVRKVYWNATPRSTMERWVEASKEMDTDFFRVDSVDDIPFVVADEFVTTEVDGREWLDQKMAAMKAHATQIAVDGPFFALSNHIGWEAWGVEHYRLVFGELGPVDPKTGRESDLFAGLDQPAEGVRTLGKIVALVLLAAVGAAAGIAGSFVHDLSVDLFGIGLPVGLPLALALAAAAYVLAGWALGNRLAVLAPGAGWLVPVLVLSVPRSEGDLVVAASAAGYLFLLGGSVLIGLGVALPYGSRGRPLRSSNGGAAPSSSAGAARPVP